MGKITLDCIPESEELTITVVMKDGTGVRFTAPVIKNRLGSKYPEHSIQIDPGKNREVFDDISNVKNISVIYCAAEDIAYRFYECYLFHKKGLFNKEIYGIYSPDTSVETSARQYTRYKIQGTVYLQDGNENKYFGNFFDISLGGFAFVSDKEPHPEHGDRLTGLGAVGSDTFWIDARVVRYDKNSHIYPLTGCEFVREIPAVKKLIESLAAKEDSDGNIQ